MFDIGFAEMMLVALVALLVLGPERLPKAARTVGFWAGRARRYMSQMTAELEREVQQAEIREKIEQTRAAFNQKVDLDSALTETEQPKPEANSGAKVKDEPVKEEPSPASAEQAEDETSDEKAPIAKSAWERAAQDAEAMEAELDAELAAEREEAEARKAAVDKK